MPYTQNNSPFLKVSKDDMPCNKPKAQSSGGKSHVVKACKDGKEKIIRFGQAGVVELVVNKTLSLKLEEIALKHVTLKI